MIPKDKGDVEAAEKLKEYPFKELKSIVPELLACLQDMNWPVGRPVADYLTTIANNITPQIIDVLRGDDATWKYWCLVVFGKRKKIDSLLLEEIMLLTTRATAAEIEEGVLDEALAILKANGG